MRARIYTIFILSSIAMLAGCQKYDALPDDAPLFEQGNASISFRGEDNWGTKGTIITNDDLENMDVFARYTAETRWTDVQSSDDMLDYMSGQDVNNTKGVWSYSPVRYWPASESEKISFFAFTPANVITCTDDATTGKPIFHYAVPHDAVETHDLCYAQKLDCTRTTAEVNFELKHSLTKIGFEAKVTGTCEGDSELDEVSYTIGGVSLFGLYRNATLSVANDGTMSWSTQNKNDDNIADKSTVEMVATHTQTLKPVGDYNLLDERADYFDVMGDNHALFALPQYLGAGIRTEAPQISVRILKHFKDAKGDIIETIYQTEAVDIPAETNGWEPEMAINYQITIDLSNLSKYDTPLTLSSKIYPWSEVELDANIHRNIYIYTGKQSIQTEEHPEDNTYFGDFMVCTNYAYMLRAPHLRVELDGAITSSRGFVFCTTAFKDVSNYSTETIKYGDVDYQVFVPTLLSIKNDNEYELPYATKADIGDADIADLEIWGYPNGYNKNKQRYELTGNLGIEYDNNGYAHVKDKTGFYRLLFLDPKQDGALTAFNYAYNTTTGNYDITFTSEDPDDPIYSDDGYVYYRININKGYSFSFGVRNSTRAQEGLYVSTSIGDDSYGINKYGEDPVYFLRLKVDESHFDSSGVLSGIINVEMISNGGGLIEQLFPVSIHK